MNPAKPGDTGTCPAGYYKQGNFCFPDKKDPDTTTGTCPPGFNKQGNVCIQNPKPPDGNGQCVPGFVKINGLCYPTKPPDGGGGGGTGEGEEEKSGFGGACASGFACEGDAIQCAIAKEQHVRSCRLFEDKSPESDLYNAEKGKDGDRTKDLPGNESVNMMGRINTTNALGGGGGGVQDLNITVAGRSVTLPFSRLNSPLQALGSLLVAISFLIAVRIIGRG